MPLLGLPSRLTTRLPGRILQRQDRLLLRLAMMIAGQKNTTEIIGGRGEATVNAPPTLTFVNVFDNAGIRRRSLVLLRSFQVCLRH